jgi:hypothetical protein
MDHSFPEVEPSAHTKGMAIVERNAKINGVEHIVVGIVGSYKAIALCGKTGAKDEAESMANAILIAKLWNDATKKTLN